MTTRLPLKDEYVTLTPLNMYQIDILATYYMENHSKLRSIYIVKNVWEAQLSSITNGLKLFDTNSHEVRNEVKINTVIGEIKLIKGLPKHLDFEQEDDL